MSELPDQLPNLSSFGHDQLPGGQAGHAGKTLKRLAHVDTVINHPLPQHCMCDASLAGADAVLFERRQVIGIPVANYHVTEHCTWQCRCSCEQVHQSEFPANVSEVVRYGPNVRALAVHLTHGQCCRWHAARNGLPSCMG